MKKLDMTAMTQLVNRAGLKVKHHSPAILLVAGTVGLVASTVMACNAKLKVNSILSDAKDKLDKIHEVMEDKTKADIYTPEDGKKDIALVYAQTGVKLVKLYAPSVALGALSVASIFTSHNIMNKRNLAIAAAYTAIDGNFKEYRDRVIDRFGERIDNELRYNIKATEIEETVVNEDGSEQTIKKTVDVVDKKSINTCSEYARFFDEGSRHWEDNAEYNLLFLRSQEAYANQRLKARGHLFLNEVYDALDIPRTEAGQYIGWVYDKNDPFASNHVDFGIYDTHHERARDFVNGYEKNILLDFNVDGPVAHLLA